MTKLLERIDELTRRFLPQNKSAEGGPGSGRHAGGGGEKRTFENYHERTQAKFKEVSQKELEGFKGVKPDYQSPGFNGGSAYFHKGDTVYRYSNHWGKFGNVHWSIRDSKGKEIAPTVVNGINKSPYRLAKAKLTSFKDYHGGH